MDYIDIASSYIILLILHVKLTENVLHKRFC